MFLYILLFFILLWTILLGFSLWHEIIPYKNRLYLLEESKALLSQNRILSRHIDASKCQQLCNSQTICKAYTHLKGHCTIYSAVSSIDQSDSSFYRKLWVLESKRISFLRAQFRLTNISKIYKFFYLFDAKNHLNYCYVSNHCFIFSSLYLDSVLILFSVLDINIFTPFGIDFPALV